MNEIDMDFYEQDGTYGWKVESLSHEPDNAVSIEVCEESDCARSPRRWLRGAWSPSHRRIPISATDSRIIAEAGGVFTAFEGIVSLSLPRDRASQFAKLEVASRLRNGSRLAHGYSGVWEGTDTITFELSGIASGPQQGSIPAIIMAGKEKVSRFDNQTQWLEANANNLVIMDYVKKRFVFFNEEEAVLFQLRFSDEVRRV